MNVRCRVLLELNLSEYEYASIIDFPSYTPERQNAYTHNALKSHHFLSDPVVEIASFISLISSATTLLSGFPFPWYLSFPHQNRSQETVLHVVLMYHTSTTHLTRISLAFSSSPCATNHRGDSGINHTNTITNIDGKP